MLDLRVVLALLFCVVVCTGKDRQEVAAEPANAKTIVEDDSDMYMEHIEDDHQPASSNYQAGEWFPSFGRAYEPYDHPPSGHSRPAFYNTYQQQEGAYSQRNEPFQQDLSFNQAKTYPYKKQVQVQAQTQQNPKDEAAALLGDGNFGIIRGGTFYPEKDGYETEGGGYDDFSSYFHNGHGRPSYSFRSNPKPVKQQQFENFRDFADINSNAPVERQYSQYVVVYTNKNGTRIQTNEPKGSPENQAKAVQIDVKRPKNILESLALLDQGDNKKGDHEEVVYLTRTMMLPSYNQGDLIEIPPEKKQSKSKRKLAELLPEKKHEARLVQKARDMSEPLLALS
ncbi:uncharacterized protein [Euwallacea similis]|uniref:uncharacterized protein n=1 Tax=Euwallacea similis TaxID=1736056 RepID=UPI00344E92A5